jgi:hypothetical protein
MSKKTFDTEEAKEAYTQIMDNACPCETLECKGQFIAVFGNVEHSALAMNLILGEKGSHQTEVMVILTPTDAEALADGLKESIKRLKESVQ